LPVFQFNKLQYVKLQVSNRVMWMVHWQQLRQVTSPHLQRILNQRATIKLLIYRAVLFSTKKFYSLIYGILLYVMNL